jgi:DNA primase
MQLAFQIGYAPQGWDNLATAMRQHRWDARGMAAAGLVARSEKTGNLFDRFRHRLIFPICDALGRPIAFGGRKLDEQDEPKYLNSPEHALFNKSATLYGLHLAKKAIIDSGTVVIVEGYTDVIACHQAGVCNVVATLGTALTPQHAKQLRRYAKKVVLIFDADDAGQKAADRALEIFLTESLDVAIAVLPDGLDPADLLGKPDGLEQWNASVDGATDALAYQFARFRGRMMAEDSISGRQNAAEAYIQRLAQVGLGQVNPIRRALLLRQLADLLGVPERTIEMMLRKHKPRRPIEAAEGEMPMDEAPPAPAGIAAPRLRALQAAERHLIGGLLANPALFHQPMPDGLTLDEAVTPSELITPLAARLYEWMYDALAAGNEVTLGGLLAEMAERGKQDLAQLATDAEREVAACCGEESEALAQLVVDAGQVIREHHARQAYEQTRQNASNGDVNDQALHEIAAHLKNRPHPGRMPVVRR